MKKTLISILSTLLLLIGCQTKPDKTKKNLINAGLFIERDISKKILEEPLIQVTKKEVPVLCYHRIRNILPRDGANMKTYSVSPAVFAEQIKALSDNGYQTILPEQLFEYLTNGKPLPAKPVIITFDDTREEQYRLGAVEMNKYGFKGVFFIMTVAINKPGYMSESQIKKLSDSGHTIGAHTWDHHMVTKYTAEDWNTQLVKPKKQLENITGKKVDYFAYPFGLWNTNAITEIKNQGYKLAFSLSDKSDLKEPNYTVRRIIVPGSWSAPRMIKAMETSFNKQH
ncbi:polysaccharide deacetylase family protein [Flavobacterium sp. K5-23]|uniref:polysaccharide deacetylase family protein n=1 Tax=Flavobacterium sp. K5-23 TaxID=2746225 RepID=UPI00200C6BA2|nr:polysaccharide deacetylase family protein [Flavobacterium sp. K5-23]UQD55531.1 polysaccharide deacetylase family protein [Flavobacterium sp. K5-23]